MNFLDVLDLFSDPLPQQRDTQTRPGIPKIFILFYVLLSISIFCFLLELNSIFNLLSPILFLGVFCIAGLILTGLTIVVSYKLKLIAGLRKRYFFAVLIQMTLLTFALASFVNRTFELTKHESLVTITNPLPGANFDRVLVKLNGKETRIRVSKSIGLLQAGDSLMIEEKEGRLGFEIISQVRLK